MRRFRPSARVLLAGSDIPATWTEDARPWLGALLLAYYDPEGRLVYAGRAGAGIKQAEPLIRFLSVAVRLISMQRLSKQSRVHPWPVSPVARRY
jgi:ATP-dependent DNA ligase